MYENRTSESYIGDKRGLRKTYVGFEKKLYIGYFEIIHCSICGVALMGLLNIILSQSWYSC